MATKDDFPTDADDDVLTGDPEPLIPDEVVKNALEVYDSVKLAPKAFPQRASMFKSVKRMLELGLRWSEQKGPQLPDDRRRAARQALETVTAELDAMKLHPKRKASPRKRKPSPPKR